MPETNLEKARSIRIENVCNKGRGPIDILGEQSSKKLCFTGTCSPANRTVTKMIAVAFNHGFDPGVSAYIQCNGCDHHKRIKRSFVFPPRRPE